MRKVRLFNITDVSTPALEEKGQVNIIVAGRGFSVPPGDSREIYLTPGNLRAIQHAVSAGLLAVDNLPVSYMLAKKKEVMVKRRARR